MAVDADDESQSNRLEGTGADTRAPAFVETILNSYALQTATAGLLVMVIAFIVNTGIWPAILGIWGAAFVLFGLTAHAVVSYLQRGSRG